MNKRMMIAIFALWGLTSAARAEDVSVLGFWQTMKGGQPASVVEVYLQNGKLHGKVKNIYLARGEAEPICTNCTGQRKDQPIRGMEILSGFQLSGDKWIGGRVFSPARNQAFDGELWLESGTLKLKASWGFISRTQTWHRVPISEQTFPKKNSAMSASLCPSRNSVFKPRYIL